MATDYLSSVFGDLSLGAALRSALSIAESSTRQRVLSKFRVNALFKRPALFRLNSRAASVEPPRVERRPICRASKQQFEAVEEVKTQEAREFIGRMEKQRIARLERERARTVELLTRQEAKLEAERRRREQLEEAKINEKRHKLQEIREISERRKENEKALAKELDKAYRKVAHSTPLYKIIEANYVSQQLMPELERKKAELAKKRMLLKRIDVNQLNEHARQHDEFLKRLKVRKLMEGQERKTDEKQYLEQAPTNQFHKILQEEAQKAEEERRAKEEYRQALLERKKHYSQLVKEMFRPAIDPEKQKELELLKAKLAISVRKASSSCSNHSHIPRRKWKKNPLVPEPTPKREGKIVDYLAEQRRMRENQPPKPLNWEKELQNVSEEEKDQKLRMLAEKMEQQVKIKEGRMDHAYSLEVGAEVSNLLIGCIRTKLAILDTETSQ